MDFEYLANPLNRRKKKYKYYLRKFEDFIKLILIYFIILPLSLPILLKNYFFSHNYFFKDFVNQNGSVFIVFTFLEMKKSKFSIRITDFYDVLKRFGLCSLLKYFSLNLYFRNLKTISFSDKNSDFYFNSDYFDFFDKKLTIDNNNFVMPFYLPREYYLDKKIEVFKKLNKSKKKFKIIFSGTIHQEWYGNLNFIDSKKRKFLSRNEIFDILVENFEDKILIIENQSDLIKVESSDKEIIILKTNPDLSLRKKNFTNLQHLELISKSKFFLCMPGTSMPLCYHLIESCMLGTVPILSYNDYLFPKFKDDQAIFFSKKYELIEAINRALNIDDSNHLIMQNKIINYYNEHLDPKNVGKKIINKNFPLEVFINLDHISTKKREERIPEMKKNFNY